MIRADMIPPDAMYAAWKAMNAGMTLNDALAAALNAWPGMALDGPVTANGRWLVPPVVVLPLPQESNNAEG